MTLINHIERGPVWNKKGPRRPPMLYSGPKGGAKDLELDKGPRPGGKGPHTGGPETASGPNDGGPEVLLKRPDPRPV